MNEKLEKILNEGKASIVDGPGRKSAHVKVQTPSDDNQELIAKLETMGIIDGKKARKKLKKKVKLSKTKKGQKKLRKASDKVLTKQIKAMKKGKVIKEDVDITEGAIKKVLKKTPQDVKQAREFIRKHGTKLLTSAQHKQMKEARLIVKNWEKELNESVETGKKLEDMGKRNLKVAKTKNEKIQAEAQRTAGIVLQRKEQK